jgi:hypothetical protein
LADIAVVQPVGYIDPLVGYTQAPQQAG